MSHQKISSFSTQQDLSNRVSWTWGTSETKKFVSFSEGNALESICMLLPDIPSSSSAISRNLNWVRMKAYLIANISSKGLTQIGWPVQKFQSFEKKKWFFFHWASRNFGKLIPSRKVGIDYITFPNQFPISHVVNQFPIIWMCWWRNLKITKKKRKEMALHNSIFQYITITSIFLFSVSTEWLSNAWWLKMISGEGPDILLTKIINFGTAPSLRHEQ